MTAINDLAEVAGSMRYAGGLVSLDRAMAGIRMPVSFLYESLSRSLIDLKSDTLMAVKIPHASNRDIPVEQALPIDIYSLIDEVRRSVSGMQESTASIPDIYAHYAYPVASLPEVASNRVGPSVPMQPVRDDGINREPYRASSTDVEPVVRQKVTEKEGPIGETPAKPAYAFEQDIEHSNLIIKRLRDDSAILAWDMADIERMVDEAIRLSYGGSAGSISIASAGYMEPPRAEAVEVEKVHMTRPEAGMPRAQDERLSPSGVRKYPVNMDTVETRPSASIARGLAEGIGLLNIIHKSTVDTILLQAAMARDVRGSMALDSLQSSVEPANREGRYIPSEASGSSIVGLKDDEPGVVVPNVRTTMSPMSHAMDVTKIFNSLVQSYLAARGTAPGRNATKEGITQLLLSLPGPQTVEGPVPDLFNVAARLQDARPAAIEAPASEDTSMRYTILGDLRELRGTMVTLQAAVDGLRPGVSSATGSLETAGPTEIPASTSLFDSDIMAGSIPEMGQPGLDGISGELLSVQGSIARLQAAFNYLRVNVPTLADFVVLQKFIENAPPEQAVNVPQAMPSLGFAIEGVQPKSAPIRLPDYSWVTQEFRQMQGMIARLQVPMYAEGGLVEQPTLAFVGESEPEWIVPMSAWDNSQARLNEFYSLLWSQIQDLGTAMQVTVNGVNEALGSVQAAGGETKEDKGDAKDYEVKYEEQLTDVVSRFLDPYLKQFNLTMTGMKSSITSVSEAGFLSASSGIATLYGTDKLKDYFLGGDEEKKKDEDKGGGKEAEDSDDSDEEDFWDLIEGLDDAASISDKRNGKFGEDD